MSDEKKSRKFKSSASSSNGGGSASSNAYGGYTFIEGYLGEADYRWLEDNIDGIEEYCFTLVFQLPPHLKFNSSWDEKSGKFLATLTNQDPDHADYKRILTSRGDTRLDAAYALYYRHFIKFANGWGEAKDRNPSRWG